MAPSSFLTAFFLLPWTSFAGDPKAISLGVSKVKHRRDARQIVDRDNSHPVTVDNARMAYFVDVTVGTPPQQIRAQIDTGSADFWVPHSGTALGGYSLKDSTSGSRLNSTFNTTYGDGLSLDVSGVFVKDVLKMGDIEIKDMQFAWADQYNPMQSAFLSGLTGTYGMMGLGSELLEAGSAYRNDTPYPNVISSLKAQGLIAAEAFSLFLNSADAPSGTIIFGGVDSSRYKKPLISLPLIPNPRSSTTPHYAVQLTSIAAQSHSGISSFTSTNQTQPMYAVLDSGAPTIDLPEPLVSAIYAYLGATFIPSLGGTAVVPCNISTADAVFSFYFGGGPDSLKISVPIADLIQPSLPLTDGTIYSDSTHSSACPLLIRPSAGYAVVLGDAFLRSAYVVYDLDNKQIAMAQANLTSTAAPHIEEIKPGVSGIPGVTTIMQPLPWGSNNSFIAATPTTIAITSVQPSGALAFSYNHTIPYYPLRGSVTAVAPAGALFTSTGFVVPSVGMNRASLGGTATAAGGGSGGNVGPTPTSSPSGGPSASTSAPANSRAGKRRGGGGLMGSFVILLGCYFLFSN